MNYIIEDNFDFWKELEDETSICNDENICMLTKTPLTKNYITLLCGHKFNYKCLVDEIFTSKYNYNRYDNQRKLHKYEIRCPYCRSINYGLLPTIKTELNSESGVTGVTSKNKHIPHRTCRFVMKRGKRKGEPCNSNHAYDDVNGTFCEKHHRCMINEKRDLENKSNHPELFKKKCKELTELIPKTYNLKIPKKKADLIDLILKESFYKK